MNASAAFENRKDALLEQLNRAGSPQQAAEAAVMTLEMVACDLAQDEQDALARQRQQAVLAIARRAPAMLRAARAEGELVLPGRETAAQEKRKIGLREAGALLLGALAVAMLVDGKVIFAVLQAAGAGMMDSMLEKLADIYSERLDRNIRAGEAMVEPALVTLLAIVVGAVLLSVMVPLAGMLAGMM